MKTSPVRQATAACFEALLCVSLGGEEASYQGRRPSLQIYCEADSDQSYWIGAACETAC
jgi:hypothetical protein